jgi:hypothetical protein
MNIAHRWVRVGLQVSIFVLAFFSRPLAAHASLDEAMAKLRAAVLREIKPGDKAPSTNHATQMAMLLARLQADVDHQAWHDANSQLNFFAEQEKSPELIQLMHEVRLEILKQSEAIENALISRIDATVKEASQKCTAARYATDLDEPFRRLSELRPSNMLQPERLRASYLTLDRAIAFVVRWQDCLIKQAAEKPAEAASIVEGLLNDPNVHPMVERSQLLFRLEELKRAVPLKAQPEPVAKSVAKMIAETDSLDDLPRLLADLEYLKKGDKNSHVLIQQVRLLQTAYYEYQSGFYGEAFQHCVAAPRPSESQQVQLLPLQEKLLLKLLPCYLNIDPSRVDSSPTMTAWQSLLNVVAAARSRQDWRLALHALETMRLIGFRLGPLPPWLDADIAGLSNVVAGANAEAAGIPSQAIAAYEKALTSTGQNVPVDWIAERVRALGKSGDGPPSRKHRGR